MVDGTDDEKRERRSDVCPHQRDRDGKKCFDTARAVQVDAFVNALGNTGHAGHIHHHVVANGLPDQRDGNAVNHELLVAQPQRRHLAGFTEQGDQAVEHTVVRVINGAENGADNDLSLIHI